MQATEMRYLRIIEGKTKTGKIGNQTLRVWLGIIPLREMIELAQLRWFGHVVRMGNERYAKFPCKLEHGKRASGKFGKEGFRRF
jgi:hypothetical protein